MTSTKLELRSFFSILTIIITIKVLVIAGFFTYFLWNKSAGVQYPQLCSETHCIDLEIADTPLKRKIGLMYRESLPALSGMLFLFENEGRHTFWMQDTKIPLDILWLDEKYRILEVQTADICEKDPCPQYIPEIAARHVLEINAGSAKTLGLITGMSLIPNF